jgi:hypothetical protein
MLPLLLLLLMLMLTKDDLATIQNANHLVPWRLVVVDLEQLCSTSIDFSAYARHKPDICLLDSPQPQTDDEAIASHNDPDPTTIRTTPRSGPH